ncbi:Na/Pi symporter [candidate division WOR-3 bacterium]|nr:Na/Pi symporter [candidate division WOR-3 bacterium]MCK4527724.1 Na/Pi symporter [candidate division WOR-3 bacterium]
MSTHRTTLKIIVNVLLAFLYLYLFLLGIELFGTSLKGFGSGFAEVLIKTTTNPVIGLFIGLFVTTIIQSSSVTTSLTVGFVAAGTITVPNAIPIIMGANIGTTITNIIASFGHFTVEREFNRAFSAAIVHDIFNLLAVAILLPLEISFHFIERASGFLTDFLLGKGGVTFESPLDIILEPVSDKIIAITGGHYKLSAVIAFILVILAISLFVKTLRKASAGKFETLIDQYLFRNAFTAGILGLGLTAFVQSSSVVTSVIVPLVGAGIVSIEQIYPYTLGANLGTTLTTILAALVTGHVNAIRVALCHSLFNTFGIMIWYPLRRIPISLAKKVGYLPGKKRFLAFLYIMLIFIVIPGIVILIFRG